MTGTTFYSIEKTPDGRSGGSTQAETRVYNERLIISLVRHHRQLSKADLTRLTGLAPQTITTIVNRLADNGLLLRLEPLRGRLGQPSMPYSLNPAGAYSFGLKVDHHTADVAMVNFVGDVLAFERLRFDYPVPAEVLAFTRTTITAMCRKHKSVSTERLAGLGIASPFYQWDWSADVGAAAKGIASWREVDIRAELDRTFDWPVYLFNDATVAAGAELMFGSGLGYSDFLYAYVGDAIGGGLVLDHRLFPGRNNLAAAIGKLPAGTSAVAGSGAFFEIASLRSLTQRVDAASASRIASSPDDWGDLGPAQAMWIEEVADGLAYAARSAVALIDIDKLIFDGAIPANVRKEIAKALRRRLARILAERPEPFSVLEGSFGHLAPVIGGASIPLLVKYSNDKELLFKERSGSRSSA